MINKQFNELSMSEKMQLQKLMKKKKNGEELNFDEQELYDRFSEEFTQAEKTAKSKWPVIILLFVSSLIVVLSKCQ